MCQLFWNCVDMHEDRYCKMLSINIVFKSLQSHCDENKRVYLVQKLQIGESLSNS